MGKELLIEQYENQLAIKSRENDALRSKLELYEHFCIQLGALSFLSVHALLDELDNALRKLEE